MILKFQQICSPCFAKQNRKSDFQCAFETTMETVRTCVREPIMSIFREASLTAQSDAAEISESRNNFSDSHEVQEDSAREKAPFPWLSEKSEAKSRQSEEKLELNGPPGRDTMNRRTSLIRSVRMAMESLKRLRKSSSESARNSGENLADAASTWTAQLNEENVSLKNSSNTSRASASPITLRSPRRSEHLQDRLSKASSLDVSEGVISTDPEPRRGGRCRPDCRGPWSSWTYSRRNSRSPADHGRHASQSSRSFESTEDNEDNN